MRRRITIWAVCCFALIAWTGLAFAQTATPSAMKTVKLPNGREVFDISGEWDADIENVGAWARYGVYTNVFKITQEGRSFTGIRLKDNPPPSVGKAGSKCIQGEVDRNGFTKLEMVGGAGEILPSDAKLSENGNKIHIDAYGNVLNKDSSKMARIALTRK